MARQEEAQRLYNDFRDIVDAIHRVEDGDPFGESVWVEESLQTFCEAVCDL